MDIIKRDSYFSQFAMPPKS